MGVELHVLTILLAMAASGWVPYIIGVNTAEAGSVGDHDSQDFSRPANPSLQRPWVHRAHRAHLNLLEQGMPFAALVLLLAFLDGFSALTAWTCVAFLALRVVHAMGMITGRLGLPGRPIVFTLGWVCCVILVVAVYLA